MTEYTIQTHDQRSHRDYTPADDVCSLRRQCLKKWLRAANVWYCYHRFFLQNHV